MRRRRKILLVALMLSLVTAGTSLALLPLAPCTWRITLADEFKGSKLNTLTWSTAYASGSNGELQYYAPDAFEVAGGVLRIKAEPRAMRGYPYTSGILTTQGLFSQRYGFFVIRARLPAGQGYWPAFWMIPATPNKPWEIDIFELHGHEPDKIYMTNHWLDGNGEHVWKNHPYTGPDFSNGFHTFALKWTPAQLVWYIDGVERARNSEGVPAQPMFILANLAVGGTWPGDPDATTTFPGYLEIDYIRVYQQTCWSGAAPNWRTWPPLAGLSARRPSL